MRLLVGLSVVMALTATAATPAFAGPPLTSQFESGSGPQPTDRSGQQLDFKTKTDAYDRMTVPVKIDGAGPFRFMIDTGADRTAVSRELATSLRLPAGERAQLHSVTGSTEVQTVTIGQLGLAEKLVRIIDAPLLNSVDLGADGLLGVDSLRAQAVLFDFKANTLSIRPAKRFVFDDSDAIVVQARDRNGRLILTDAMADGVKVTVVIDTGSQITIANSALRDRLLDRRRLKKLGPVELISVTGGVLQGEVAYLRKLDMGDVALGDVMIAVADAHTFAQLGLDRKPALLLGMNAMRAFDRMSIDFADRKIRLVLPKRSEAESPALASR